MSFNPCVGVFAGFRDPIEDMIQHLVGRLHEGVFWTRAEHYQGKRYDLHFTVLSVVVEDVGESKIIVHDGDHAGQVTTLRGFERDQWVARFETVSYWPVMDDEIDRVRFSPPR